MATKCKVYAKATVTGKRASEIPICAKCFVYCPTENQKEIWKAYQPSFGWEQQVAFNKVIDLAVKATFDKRMREMPVVVKEIKVLRDSKSQVIGEGDSIQMNGEPGKVLRVNLKEGKVLVQMKSSGNDYVTPEKIEIMIKNWEGEHDDSK